MRWLRTLSLALVLAFAGLTPSHAAFDDGDLICETTSTTGTGTVNLAGACTNYVTFLSQITSGSETTYTIVSGDGKIETGTGTFTDGAPDTLTRTALWSTDGSGAELSLTGVSTVYLQWNTASYKGGINSFNLLDLTAATGTFSTSVNVTSSAQTVAGSGGHLTVEGATIWDSGNDGAGSTLDADLLDGNSSAAFQPVDADLTSWALITRAAGFDTFATTPSSANLRSLLTDEVGTGVLVFSGTPADDQVSVGDSASAVTWRTIADSDAATQKLQYDQATNTFSAGTDDDVPDAADFTNLTGGTGITNTTGTLSVDFTELTFGSGLTSTGASTVDCDAATTSATGCSTLTTTTEALTGTDTAKNITADAMAALWEKGSNVASAGTVSLGEGWLFHITGTTTITDIDFATAKDGRQAVIIFDGALTLTHNATTLDIPGGANITTAAGDVAFITQDSGDNIKVTGYIRDAAAPISGTNTGDQTITLTGDVTGTGTGSFAATIAADSVALGTDTTGVYVSQVADGTGIDGTCNAETCTYTPTLDLTEISTATFGAGAFTTMIWDAGATDPTATFASNSVTWSNAATYSLGTSAAFTTGTVELGAASDTTIARTGAGAISVEGSAVQLASTVDVVQVADGTGVDGTCSTAACTYTPTLDLTELATATFGAGTFTTLAFDAGATDPTFTFASNSTTVSNSAVFSLGTSAAFTTGTIEVGAASDTTVARGSAGHLSVEGATVWDSGNDGSGSTLDADLLDGVSSASFALAATDFTAGTGLSGGGTLAANRTFTLDTTEVTSNTWGVNNFTTQAFSTDGVDLTWDYTTVDGAAVLSGGGTSPILGIEDGGQLRFFEEDAGGSNTISFIAPTTLASDRTCQLVDGAAPIPDSCVGDGTDTGGSGAAISGTPADNQVAVWTNSTTIEGDSAFTFDTATDSLSVGTSGVFTTGTIELGAASDTTIARSAAGGATLEGKAIKRAGKQMMWIGAAAMIGNITSGADCTAQYDSGSNDLTVRVCAFDTGATEERADFQIAMPKSWDEGTVTAEFVWTNTAGASSSVAWEMGCVAISNDDTLNATMGTTQVTVDAWIATNDQHTTSESSAITCGGTPAEGDIVAFRVNRDTSNASDAMAGDALLIGLKLYWTDNASTSAE